MAGSGDVGRSRGSTTRVDQHQPGQPSLCKSKFPCRSDMPPGSAPQLSGPGSRTASSWSVSRPGRRRSGEIRCPHRSTRTKGKEEFRGRITRSFKKNSLKNLYFVEKKIVRYCKKMRQRM